MYQEFVPIKGYENRYLISPDGKVYSIVRKKMMKPFKNERGYMCIDLFVNYNRKSAKIHRLVADAFIPNPEGKKEINHIDGNKENNCVDNLEWSTRSENMKHAYALGLRKPTYGKSKERR